MPAPIAVPGGFVEAFDDEDLFEDVLGNGVEPAVEVGRVVALGGCK
jgi:hypothetical protein